MPHDHGAEAQPDSHPQAWSRAATNMQPCCRLLTKDYTLRSRDNHRAAHIALLVLAIDCKKRAKIRKILLKMSAFSFRVQRYEKISNYAKKRKDVITTSQSLLNLKSNTMKNTMQNYCFSAIPPNILLKKSLKHRNFRYFAIYILQNMVKFTFLGIILGPFTFSIAFFQKTENYFSKCCFIASALARETGIRLSEPNNSKS